MNLNNYFERLTSTVWAEMGREWTPAPEPHEVLEGVALMVSRIASGQAEDELAETFSQRLELIAPTGTVGLGEADGVRLLIECHTHWLAALNAAGDGPVPLHPLAPVIEAWLRTAPIETNGHDRPILNHTVGRMSGSAPAIIRSDTVQGKLRWDVEPERGGPLGPVSMAQIVMPSFKTDATIVPSMMGFHTPDGRLIERRGRGAPIETRTWYAILLRVPPDALRAGEEVRLRYTLRDLVNDLYPNGTDKWERETDLPKIRFGLYVADQFRVTHGDLDWRLMNVEALPRRETSLDAVIPITVKMPDRVGNGAIVDRSALTLYGARSAPAFRAWLRLAQIWDEAKARNGGFRIYDARPSVKRDSDDCLLDHAGERITRRDGSPVRDWSHPRAVRLGLFDEVTPERTRARVPTLSGFDLVALCYDSQPVHPITFRTRLKRAKAALEGMERDGWVKIERLPDGWRVLEVRREGASLIGSA